MKARTTICWLVLPSLTWLTAAQQVQAAPDHILLRLLTEELDYST